MRILWLLLVFASAKAFANSKSLFVHGFNAASYGDIGVDKGQWHGGDSISALRLRAGVQLLRLDFVGLAAGYQKVGFYDAQYNWDRQSRAIRYDYRGPFLELHLFPRALFSFSLAGMYGTGFSFLEEENKSLYSYTPCSGCQVIVERSELNVSEYTGHLAWRVAKGLQLQLGMGTRIVRGRPEYEVEQSPGERSWEREGGVSWKDEPESFLYFGIRGSNL